jgi:hypothetical protein
MKNIDKNWCRYVPYMLLDIILAQWWRPVASSVALDLLLWAMHAVTYRHIAMVIKNGQQSRCIFSSSFVCLLPWWRQDQNGASSCPMAASSGFSYSPGHAALCDAACIAPLLLHGHQNGLQWNFIHLSPSPFLFALNVDKDHVIVNVN